MLFVLGNTLIPCMRWFYLTRMTNIDFKSIRNMYLAERQSKLLTPVEDDFYPSLTKFLDSLASYVQTLRIEKKPEEDIKSAISTIEKTRSFAIEIVKLRRKKIITELYSAVLSSSGRPEVEIPNLTPEEKALYSALAESAGGYNLATIQKLLEAGRVPEKIEVPPTIEAEIEKEKKAPKVEVPIIIISIVEDITDSVVDSHGTPWPALQTGAIVGAPMDVAEKLINGGKAILLCGGRA